MYFDHLVLELTIILALYFDQFVFDAIFLPPNPQHPFSEDLELGSKVKWVTQEVGW